MIQTFSHLPLAGRILYSQNSSIQFQTPKTAYCKWDEEALIGALKAVDKGLSIRRAAEMYRIPKSTLSDYCTGKVKLGSKKGPKPLFTVEEEEELVSFLIETAKIGYPHTKKQVLELISHILTNRGKDTQVTDGWWSSFRKRHPQLTLRSAVPLSYARAKAQDEESN